MPSPTPITYSLLSVFQSAPFGMSWYQVKVPALAQPTADEQTSPSRPIAATRARRVGRSRGVTKFERGSTVRHASSIEARASSEEPGDARRQSCVSRVFWLSRKLVPFPTGRRLQVPAGLAHCIVTLARHDHHP